MRTTATIIAALLVLLSASCSSKQELKEQEGLLDVTGGKIWYRVVGQGDKTPVLMLHGGPGYPSYYFNPLMEIGKERPVITFDQLGCGRSDRITDTTLMTIDSYVEQTRKLLNHLGVKDFYLYGHSWGTMLGTDYYLKYKDGIKGLILGSPCLSSKMWVKDADTLISTLPDSISMVLRNDIKGVSQDSATLASAIGYYFGNFYTRKQPTSADLDSAQAQMGMSVYQYMWGTSEFSATGTLKDFDRTGDLDKINVPALFIAGEFDAARPSTVRYYQSLTPNSKMIIISNAGHMTMHDNPAEDIKAISGFLSELDNNQ
jgi:proline iminopeptidase